MVRRLVPATAEPATSCVRTPACLARPAPWQGYGCLGPAVQPRSLSDAPPHPPSSLPLPVQVVVDFTATWCGPCQRIAPIFTKLAEEMPEVCFVKVDVDENEEVAQECGVESMPTFQFYKSGLKVHEFSGAAEDKIKAAIAQFK